MWTTGTAVANVRTTNGNDKVSLRGLVSEATRDYQRYSSGRWTEVERWLKDARRVQQNLVPGQQDLPGLEIAVHFQPYFPVGGDYVDVVECPDGRVALVAGDVSGKGLQGAMVVSCLHSLTHAYLAEGLDPGSLVARLNAYLCRYLPEDRFVTMACVLVDPRTGETAAVNAGHLPPIVVDRSGEERRLKSGSTLPLGVEREVAEVQHDRLAPDELLAMFTDGLTEMVSPAGELLTLGGLIEHLSRMYHAANGEALGELAADVEKRLVRFRGGGDPCDDCALVLARRN